VDIYLMRHGKAEVAGQGGSDAARRLTKKGHDEIRAVARWMKAQDLSFDLIAASPLARAQETAGIVAAALGPETVESWEVLVPGGNPDTVCHAIGRYPDTATLLLVGHEPLLSALASRMVAGDENARIAMTKGAVAKIRNFSFEAGCTGELHWLITARQMAAFMP